MILASSTKPKREGKYEKKMKKRKPKTKIITKGKNKFKKKPLKEKGGRKERKTRRTLKEEHCRHVIS